MCKVTVITVTYNAEKYIEETIKSVLAQNYKDYEYIIKDGDSTDNTDALIRKYINNDIKKIEYIKGKDDGIYDAMNIAVCAAKGEWIIFMNAGDTFYDENVLRNIFCNQYANKVGVLYGHAFMKLINDRGFVQTYDAEMLLKGHSICHQAVLEKKQYLLKYPFEVTLKILADREHFLHLLSKGINFERVNMIVAREDRDGISSTNYPQFFCEEDIINKKYGLECKQKNRGIGFIKMHVKRILPQLEEFVMIKKAIERMV
mgnify:CR=1 FL=1